MRIMEKLEYAILDEQESRVRQLLDRVDNLLFKEKDLLDSKKFVHVKEGCLTGS